MKGYRYAIRGNQGYLVPRRKLNPGELLVIGGLLLFAILEVCS